MTEKSEVERSGEPDGVMCCPQENGSPDEIKVCIRPDLACSARKGYLCRNSASCRFKEESKHPELCKKCGKESSIQEDGPDAGEQFSCGMMVEAMDTGMPVLSCGHFSPKKSRFIDSLIDAETAQAAVIMQEARAVIQKTPFADKTPFDPVRFVSDRVGS